MEVDHPNGNCTIDLRTMQTPSFSFHYITQQYHDRVPEQILGNESIHSWIWYSSNFYWIEWHNLGNITLNQRHHNDVIVALSDALRGIWKSLKWNFINRKNLHNFEWKNLKMHSRWCRGKSRSSESMWMAAKYFHTNIWIMIDPAEGFRVHTIMQSLWISWHQYCTRPYFRVKNVARVQKSLDQFSSSCMEIDRRLLCIFWERIKGCLQLNNGHE